MKYSFVIPCYQSEKTIGTVVKEIQETVEKEQLGDYEIILVNDCSPDNVWETIKDICASDHHVKGVCLAKNFGQHAALLAGYRKVTGDVVISLDDDGQSPIEYLRMLLDELDNNNDVVYSYCEGRKEPLYRRMGSSFALLMCKVFINAPKDFKGSSFYVARRFVIDEMIRYDNAYPYLPGLIFRTTRKIGYVKAVHKKRLQGRSGYSFRKLLGLWLNGFTAFSVKPLEIGSWTGAILAFGGFGGLIYTVINKFLNPDTAVGWTSLISVSFLIGGIQLLMLGLIGEYIGRIYICLNKSPQYVIREETETVETEEIK